LTVSTCSVVKRLKESNNQNVNIQGGDGTTWRERME